MSSKLTPKYNYLTKRVFDLFLSVVLLLILSPLLIFVAAFVAIDLGFPIFFRQKRPGFKGEIFTIYKFRTMRDSKDAQGKLLSDKSRLTKFGRFLRATSLDELPELFNILKGEMSLVGPRPLLIEYLPRYNPHQSRRHDVLPGMTGWAQIHGRNDITWKEKFDLDVWYVDHWSFWLDLKIIGLTIIKVLRREGISQPGQATAELFLGNTEEEQQQINRDEP
jgi:lipopolysaccharide/colanic/teichoic acid biosynthesis glycosyltransferase